MRLTVLYPTLMVVNSALQDITCRTLLWSRAELHATGFGNVGVTEEIWPIFGKARACFQVYEKKSCIKCFSFLSFSL